MTFALTKRVVDRASYKGNGRSHCILWDTDVRGFGLRVHPSGQKAFVLFFRTQTARKRLLTLGGYPEITVDQARRLAKKNLLEIAQGADPAELRRAARQVSTFGELAERYVEDYAKARKRSHADDEQRIRDYLKPAWGPRPAIAIKRADVAALHRQVGRKKPYAANRTLALVSRIFSWGEKAGLLPEGHPNPAKGIETFKEKSRDRFLSAEEAGRLLKAIDAEENIYVRAFFWLSLLLGTRKNELLRARWKDVDLDASVLTIPETKADRPGRPSAAHHIPLAEAARQILSNLPREAGNPFVFPGARKRSHLVNVAKAWKRVRKAAKVSGVRFHDLRRTVGSWLAQGGVTLHLIGAVLGHSQPKTTAVYARFGEKNTRDVLERHATALLAAAESAHSKDDLGAEDGEAPQAQSGISKSDA